MSASDRTLAKKLLRAVVRRGRENGMVVATQYLCTDCQILLPDGKKEWVPTDRLHFLNTKIADAVRLWAAKREILVQRDVMIAKLYPKTRFTISTTGRFKCL